MTFYNFFWNDIYFISKHISKYKTVQNIGRLFTITRKFSPPTGGFFLAPVEGCRALWAHKGILADGRTDGRTTGLRELDMLFTVFDMSMHG